jgi:transcriptional regulator with XRE-family HTH domain
MQGHDIDIRIGKNLKRLREVRTVSQQKLADMINTPQARLSAYENGREGMGKDIMARICNALNVELYEFYVNEKTPVVHDPQERRVLQKLKEARDLGIYDVMMEYAEYLIEKHRKTQKDQKIRKAG